MSIFKTTNSLATIILLSVMAFTLSACSNDGDEKENTNKSILPFVGYWQHLDEDEEYHSIITITENGNYQIRFQDGENTGTDGGKVSFDKNTNKMTFSPTFNNGTDTKTSEYQYLVREISESRLQVVDENGKSFTYEKTSNGTFTEHSDWGKSLVGGTWKFYVKDTYGTILNTLTFTFFESGVYSCWNEHYQYYEDGVFNFDKKTIKLDGEEVEIKTFTSNTLKFTLNGEIYHGTRIVEKNKQLVESNKKLLVGTWSCIDYDNEKSLLILKPNGEYENKYDDGYEDYNDYKGTYYVSEDKIFFDDPKGKDGLGGEHQIVELTSKRFLLNTLENDFQTIGTKTE